jgi:hypothetical protein
MSVDAGRTRRKKSPVPNSNRLKRKIEGASHTPPPKRRKSVEPSVTDDPTRKYCLGKLEELFQDIFLRYPHLPTEKSDENDSKAHEGMVQKLQEDLTEEEKAALVKKSKQFSADLERCIYEIYHEPDKQGKSSAGPKYKYDTTKIRLIMAN